MKVLSPVVWSEGMHLAQHHFQTQNRYFEELAAFTVGSLYFRAYGLIRCELDAEALANGTVALRHARGLMPDGLPFHFPEDEPPAPLEISGIFSPVHDTHRVMLAIPPYRNGKANCALDGEVDAESMRFVSALEPVADEITGIDERRVSLARKNFRLVLDNEEHEDLIVMPIARVRRGGRGHFVYDPDYIPPSMQIGGSETLLQLLVRLIEMLDAKSEFMIRERTSSERPFAEWAASEVANFWFAHAINAAVAPLRHLLRTRSAHPEQVYAAMSSLAGALCTFSLDAHPRDLPSYDHDDLAATFIGLERHIRRHLEIIIPSNTVVVPLARAEPLFHTADMTDKRCFSGRAHWYLGVRSTASRASVAADVPKLVKICSGEHIIRLVKESLPGLTLEYDASPPSSIGPRLGSHYFRVTTAGPCWTLMSKTGSAGAYVPAAIPEAELELTIVLEE